jgi:hypothetical protein
LRDCSLALAACSAILALNKISANKEAFPHCIALLQLAPDTFSIKAVRKAKDTKSSRNDNMLTYKTFAVNSISTFNLVFAKYIAIWGNPSNHRHNSN